MPQKKNPKVRKIRATGKLEIAKDAPRFKVLTWRTEAALDRSTAYIERCERRAFIKAVRALKPVYEEWARFVKKRQGKDSADYLAIIGRWNVLAAKYKLAVQTERLYQNKPPEFNPDWLGEIW